MAGTCLADMQHPFSHPMQIQEQEIKLYGKYLHITDIHVSYLCLLQLINAMYLFYTD